jgi:hypothetical protein
MSLIHVVAPQPAHLQTHERPRDLCPQDLQGRILPALGAAAVATQAAASAIGCDNRLHFYATASSSPSAVTFAAAYSMCSTRREFFDCDFEDA